MHLVMFDVDGTLTNSYHYDADCYTAAVKEVFRIDAVDTSWISYKHATDTYITEEIAREVFGRKPTKDEERLICARFVHHLKLHFQEDVNNFQEMPGARKMLEMLAADNNIGLSIATGGWREPAHFKLTSSRFDVSDIPMASSSDNFNREKIMSISVDRARARYGQGRFESVTYVGDATWDFEAAHNLGFSFVGVGNNVETLLKAGAEYVIPNYTDLGGFLKLLASARTTPATAPRF